MIGRDGFAVSIFGVLINNLPYKIKYSGTDLHVSFIVLLPQNFPLHDAFAFQLDSFRTAARRFNKV